jgi:signal transduction histidine kinase
VPDNPLLPRRLGQRELVALDAVAGVGYALVLYLSADGAEVPPWIRALVVAGIGLPLAVRRLWPVPTFAVVLLMSVVAAPLHVGGHLFVAAAYALYTVAATQPPLRWVPTRAIGVLTAVGLLAGSVIGLPTWARDVAGAALFDAVLLGGAWTLGRAARAQRAYAAQLADRAVAEERLRIARELHDIVAHSMGVIAVKAGVANHVLPVRPDEARDALAVIESTSRAALAEMRQLLGVLRPGDDDASLAPAPGLDGIPTLADQAALTGVRVELAIDAVGTLPEGVGLSVYRIVQEALTNVVKHAAPARCQVRIGGDGGAVTVEITDDGPGRRQLPTGDAPGHGLVGMRERVALYGGTFAAGSRPGGGFAVTARLPYRAVTEAR